MKNMVDGRLGPADHDTASADPLAAATTQFGLGLADHLLGRQSHDTFFISPVGLFSALTLAYLGATGETRQQMGQTLGLPDLPLDELHRAIARSRIQFEQVKLRIATALFTRNDWPPQPAFIHQSRELFGADVTALDFGSAEAVQAINAWVRTRTDGNIDHIVDAIDPLAALFLLSAVYFKAGWMTPFSVGYTEEHPFHLPDGRSKNVWMMSMSSTSMRVCRTAEFAAVALPYVSDTVSMYIFLPNLGSNPQSVLARLRTPAWTNWQDHFPKGRSDLLIPRITLEYDVELKQPLIDLGMPAAFDQDRATFHEITTQRDENIYISSVRHKTRLAVDEQGTEAAAATRVEMRFLSGRSRAINTLIIDRPFFCAIRDDRSQTLLFLGWIVDPQPLRGARPPA